MKRDNEKRNGHDVSDGKHQSFMRKDCDRSVYRRPQAVGGPKLCKNEGN